MILKVADYRNLEMRMIAHHSRDEGMIEAIKLGRDIHCQTVAIASEIGAIESGITYDIALAAKKAKNPTEEQKALVEQRSKLKATGFGIVYGIGALKLGLQLGLKIIKERNKWGRMRERCPEAEKLIDDYLWNIYPGVGRWIEDTKDKCRDEEVVYTLRGHPRRLPDINSNDGMLRSQAERQAPNVIPQGGGADIVNEAMLRCERDPELRACGARMLLQVHDELMFEVPDHPEYIAVAERRIRANMENPFPMRVAIEIDMDTGYNWDGAKA